MITVGLCKRDDSIIGFSDHYCLTINGTPIWESSASRYLRNEDRLFAEIFDQDAVALVSGYSFSDLEPMFDRLVLWLHQPVYEGIDSVDVIFRDDADKPCFVLELGVQFTPSD